MRAAPAEARIATAGLEVAVLGPVEVRRDGVPSTSAPPSSARWWPRWPCRGGRPVSVDALVDLLWGDAPAARGATATLQAYVSGLRKVLEPDRERRARRRPCW